ncbi:hypothetical protein M4V62_08030 [Streptomyces durmitorensis]|uniref:Uncharacterized protein n=1 Tax=Streptomyces durmitorensis TaxID=319947 RepID=A0ABY4PPJ8_9ACTN|nr:hypothetical protein [Streptomyces durmitorensis]UQT55047.1 hypothetical protein M4V62_08030 [Streptomyces durmitorensis]
MSQGYLWLLEAGQRAPSVCVAEDLAAALTFRSEDYARLSAAAVVDPGRSDPAARLRDLRPGLASTPQAQDTADYGGARRCGLQS